MAVDVLAINIKGAGFTCAEIKVSGQTVRLRSLRRVEFSGSVEGSSCAGWLEKMARRRRICVSLPSEEAFVRMVKLPFGSEDKIARTVRFEAEKHLPFPAEEAAFDYRVIERGKDYSEVAFAAMRAETVREYLDALSPYGIVPDIVVPEAVCLGMLTGEQAKCAVVAEVGRSSAVVCVVKRAFPVLLRSVSAGWEEPDKLGAEISAVWGGYSLREAYEEPAELFVSGTGLPEEAVRGISEKAGMNARPLETPGVVDERAGDQAGAADEAAAAVGLALLGGTRRNSFNLKKPQEQVRSTAGVLAAAVLAVAAAAFLALGARVEYTRKLNRLAAVEAAISEVLHVAADEGLARRPEVEIISILRSRIDDADRELEALAEVGSESVLEVLREVSLRIAEGSAVSLTNVGIDRGVCRVDGRANAFREVEELFSSLSGAAYFSSARITRAQADGARGGVVFRIELDYPRDTAGSAGREGDG